MGEALGGLYALERLAQDNPDQRSTVVRVFCAYLRMPFELPGEPPQPAVGPEYEAAVLVHRERVQEREVRVAAQRILRDHLRPGDGPQPAATFWPDTDLDLIGSSLIDFDLQRCTARTAIFELATFTDSTIFKAATFDAFVVFESATFTNFANFRSATFDHVVPQEVREFLS
ncbi:pentapeptide repeat-containing protein [Umezawaea endophytica]|uniref:Pentapeptide repeat-containing protein n=1 Tax=Umezawaea endophytica TaxID=1654476 RepID=A0A9X3AL31_9PSEU|nr:pentapeptide repeat-containing protein [Umezawaea endophytica]MCS7483810.1 pentapeptide repeat-containing protein [Umezawaea endophytica]